MPKVRIVLVEPKHEGNVGAVARAMRNFNVKDLVLVRPSPLGDEARKRAMSGLSILESAHIVGTFDEALEGVDLVVGTSGIDARNEKKFLRISVGPEELANRVADVDGTVALVFGREDFGLFVEELARCDLLVTIPASPEAPILNLSHAAAILLYELYGASGPPRRKASGMEKERLAEAFRELLEATEYPEHKTERTRIMFRRLLGRALPTKWEFHALIGVFTRATKQVWRMQRRRPRGRS